MVRLPGSQASEVRWAIVDEPYGEAIGGEPDATNEVPILWVMKGKGSLKSVHEVNCRFVRGCEGKGGESGRRCGRKGTVEGRHISRV